MEDQHLLKVVLSLIAPCNTQIPYIFISYSHNDREIVWGDTLKFQREGFNIWLDEKNLDKKNPSWKDDALKAIQSENCKLVLFYASATSLCSEACLRELRASGKDGPLLVVDAEPIKSICKFLSKLQQGLPAKSLHDDEHKSKNRTLVHFEEEFFPNNERIRIRSYNHTKRLNDYHEEIRKFLPNETCHPPIFLSAPTDSLQNSGIPSQHLYTIKTLSNTDITYNICTLGSAFHVGFGVPVNVKVDGKCYVLKMHNTVKGRIDGMKKIYITHSLKLGDVLDVHYMREDSTIYLKKVSGI